MAKSNPGQAGINQGPKPPVKISEDSHRGPDGGKKHDAIPGVADPKNPGRVKRDFNPSERREG